MAEPGLLRRLRRAVQRTGLTADPAALGQDSRAILVTGRLAQTALNYLGARSPAAARELSAELRKLASPDECDLLAQGRGYTFFHVVHFLCEFARHYGDLSDSRYFCAGVGRAGGGLQLDSDTDIVGLVRLLVTAMPAGDEGRSMGRLVQTLGPLMLDKVFTTGLFRMVIAPAHEDCLRVTLEYVDRDQTRDCLAEFGLEEDLGTLFFNSALQIQGTIQNGLDILARDAESATTMTSLIEDREAESQEEIVRICACAWTVSWTPEVRLRRLHEPEEILAQMRAVYDTMHRRELEYFQERVKTLEMQVQALEEGERFHDLIGASSPMRQLYQLIRQVAEADLAVLVRGESGTGKERVAEAIHQSSPRCDRPFIAVNCAAFSENLLESELFGHEKGAFTGAEKAKPGRFELADGGTLFLDEVGDIPLTTQVKLLRVLEAQAFERVGGTRTIQVDVRFIGATNQDLEELIAQGRLREDFYFRLNVLPVALPPLREHPEDIPLLAHHFIERVSRRLGRGVKGVSRGAIEGLVDHSWPGNIRELQHVIERAVAVYASGPSLTRQDISQALGMPARKAASPALNLRQQEILTGLCRMATGCGIEEIMEQVKSASRGAGQSRRTLQNDLRKLVDLGWVRWVKHGSAYVYTVTPEGAEQGWENLG